jgi:hypothetical protein
MHSIAAGLFVSSRPRSLAAPFVIYPNNTAGARQHETSGPLAHPASAARPLRRTGRLHLAAGRARRASQRNARGAARHASPPSDPRTAAPPGMLPGPRRAAGRRAARHGGASRHASWAAPRGGSARSARRAPGRVSQAGCAGQVGEGGEDLGLGPWGATGAVTWVQCPAAVARRGRRDLDAGGDGLGGDAADRCVHAADSDGARNDGHHHGRGGGTWHVPRGPHQHAQHGPAAGVTREPMTARMPGK